jgi:signal peptide peptidase SppA
MKYLRVLLACANEPWALERNKLLAITHFLATKARGLDLARTVDEDVAKITDRKAEAIARQEGVVAIIRAFGVISQRMNMFDDFSGGTSVEMLTAAYRSLLRNEDVKAIIFEFDSPGGTVAGVEELGAEIFESRGIKPTIAVVNAFCASAAYWLASQCDEIVCTPSGQAGSIGVYTIHEDISKLLEMEGIKETLIYAGEFKVEGNEFEPLADDARQHIQGRVDETYRKFVEAVAQGRGVDAEKVNDKFGQGRMYGANELLKRGMIDRIATLDETLERFGMQVRPSVSRDRAEATRATDVMMAKIEAGERPTIREIERGTRGRALSRRESELFSKFVKAHTQGDPEQSASVTSEQVEANRQAVVALAECKDILARVTLPKLT